MKLVADGIMQCPGSFVQALSQRVGFTFGSQLRSDDRHPSTARLSNLMAVDKKLIKGPLGTMPAEDLERIESGLRCALGL